MSARCQPVAARLSRQQLRLMQRARRGWIFLWMRGDSRTARRLEPTFLEVHGEKARTTLLGCAVLNASKLPVVQP